MSCFSSIHSYFDQWHVRKQSLKTTLSSIVEQNQNNCWRKNCWTSHLLRLKYVTKKKTTFKTKQFAHLNLSGSLLPTYLLFSFYPYLSIGQVFDVRQPRSLVRISTFRSDFFIHLVLDVLMFGQTKKDPFQVGQSRVEAGAKQIALQMIQLSLTVEKYVFVKTKEI